MMLKDNQSSIVDFSFKRQYYRRSYWFQRLPMNQKLVVLLLPILLTFGTILFFRSIQTTNSISGKQIP